MDTYIPLMYVDYDQYDDHDDSDYDDSDYDEHMYDCDDSVEDDIEYCTDAQL